MSIWRKKFSSGGKFLKFQHCVRRPIWQNISWKLWLSIPNLHEFWSTALHTLTNFVNFEPQPLWPNLRRHYELLTLSKSKSCIVGKIMAYIHKFLYDFVGKVTLISVFESFQLLVNLFQGDDFVNKDENFDCLQFWKLPNCQKMPLADIFLNF